MSSGTRVTIEQREQIKMFSAAGVKQKDIAARLALSAPTVGSVQRQLGSSPNRRAGTPIPRETKNNILKLLRAGHGEPHIVQTLCVPNNWVRRLKKQFIVRKPGESGFQYRKTVLELRDLRRDIRESERALAKKHGVSRRWLSWFRHRMWGGKK